MEPSVKEIQLPKLQEILSLSLQHSKTFKGKELYAVIGNTGAGKSTTINYLMGYEFKVERSGSKRMPVLATSDENAARIGTSMSSETLYPRAHHGNGFAFLDTAGFLDNRGPEEQIAISLANRASLRTASLRGLIFVIDYPSLDAGRGATFRNLAAIASNLIKSPLNLKGSLLFIITKVPDDDITNSEIAQDIKATLESEEKNQENQGHKNNESNKNKNDFMRCIIDNLDQIYIVKVFNQQKRLELLNKIKSLIPINKEALNDNQDSVVQNFKEYAAKAASSNIQIFQELGNSAEKIKECKTELANLKARKANIEGGENISSEQLFREDMTKKIHGYRESIDKKEAQFEQLKKELKIKSAELTVKETSTNDYVIWSQSGFLEAGTVRVNQALIEYKGRPFRWAKASVDKEGGFKVDFEDPTAGKYRVNFWGTKGLLEKTRVAYSAQAFVYENEAPTTRTLIATLTETKTNLTQEIDDLKDEIKSLKSDLQQTEHRFLSEIKDAQKMVQNEKQNILLNIQYSESKLEKENTKFMELFASADALYPGARDMLEIVKVMEFKDGIFNMLNEKVEKFKRDLSIYKTL